VPLMMCVVSDGAFGDGEGDGDTQCPARFVYVGLGYICPFPTGCRVTDSTVLEFVPVTGVCCDGDRDS
jgi:hypothetical protein